MSTNYCMCCPLCCCTLVPPQSIRLPIRQKAPCFCKTPHPSSGLSNEVQIRFTIKKDFDKLKEFMCIGPFVRNQDNNDEMEKVDILVPVFYTGTRILVKCVLPILHSVNVLDE